MSLFLRDCLDVFLQSQLKKLRMQWHHSGACHCLQAAKAVLLDDKVRHLAVEIEIIDFEPGTFFATDARISRDEREPVSRVHVNHRPVAGLETFDASTTTLPKGQGIESFQVIGGPWHAVGILDFVVAVGTGVLSSGGFAAIYQPAVTMAPTTVMPLILIPGFFVPLFTITHLAAILKSRRLARDTA